jgi:DME family drug/metabolite transporter
MRTEVTIVQRTPRRGLWLIGLGSVFFGFTGVTSKTLYARSEITPLAVGWLRMLVAAVPLLALVVRRPAALPRPRSFRDLGALLGLSAGMTGYQVTFFSGIQRSTVTTVTLIAICTAPVMVALLAPVFLRERLSGAMGVALVCAVAGTALLVGSGGRVSLAGEHLSGNMLALGAAFSYACFVLISKSALSWLDSFFIIAFTFSAAALLLTPFALGDALAAGLSWGDWPYILWLGLGPTALAYALYISGPVSPPCWSR